MADTSRPTSPGGVDSDAASGAHDLSPSPPPASAPLSPEPVTASPALPPGLPAKPPGLHAPPGLPPPSRTPMSTDSSPQIPLQTSQGPYQISTQAQALLEDVKARREAGPVASGPGPFPDFDRMLQLLSTSDDTGFSFSLDPKLAGDGEDDDDEELGLPDFTSDPTIPFNGNFMDAFPRLRQAPPPGLGFPPHLDQSTFNASRGPTLERPPTASSYTGSFNPFGSDGADDSGQKFSPLDEDRKMSRFTFARGRQGSGGVTAPSPLHPPASFNHSESSSQAAYYSPPEVLSPSGHSSPQFGYGARNPHVASLHQSHSSISSPLAQYVQPQPQYVQQQQPRFQPFDQQQQQQQQQLSEAQLRDFINSSRERAGSARGSSGPAIPVNAGLFSMPENGVHVDQYRFNPNQPFADPAIMSARMASPSPIQDGGYGGGPTGLESYPSQQLAFGPPPGLAYPQGVVPNPALSNRHGKGLGGMPAAVDLSQMGGSAHGELRLYPYQGRESQVRVPSAVLPVRKLYHRP